MATTRISDSRTVHYDDTGQDRGAGRTLLLINGLGGARSSWSPLVSELEADVRVVTIDNRDAGEADAEIARYSIADMADDAAGLLRSLSIEKAHVLGHSMGGFIALEFALRHPEMLDRLILVGTAAAAGRAMGHDFPPPPREEWIDDPVERGKASMASSYAPGFFDRNPGLLETFAERGRGNRITWEGYSRQVAAINDHDVRDRLSDITAPTLVIHGDVDPSLGLKGGEIIAQGIPGARLLVYGGVGHHPMREQPERFVQDVRSFLTN